MKQCVSGLLLDVKFSLQSQSYIQGRNTLIQELLFFCLLESQRMTQPLV